jgi:hypothetical protein
MPEKLSQQVIERWLEFSAGQFTTKDIWDVLDIRTPENRAYLRVILDRLCKAGTILRTSKDGVYRKIDSEKIEMDWESADPSKVLPVKFPFGIEEHAKLYPKSVVIIAAPKNGGKTALAYNILKLNMHQFDIDVFNSETGPEQMKERLEPLDIPSPAPFKVYERYDNFADVMNPNHFTIIDYMDTGSETYMVGEEIDRVFRKTNCVAVICLQKPPFVERDLAYGGGFTAKRAALYISMGNNKLKLVYVKTPAKRGVNPNNMTWTFRISDNGTVFENIQRYYGE